MEELARVGARLVLQRVLEAEIAEFLGRNRYERRAGAKDARAGSRNGHSDLRVKSTAGPVVLKRQKLRGTADTFTSRLLGTGGDQNQRLGVARHRQLRARAVGSPGSDGLIVEWWDYVTGSPSRIRLTAHV